MSSDHNGAPDRVGQGPAVGSALHDVTFAARGLVVDFDDDGRRRFSDPADLGGVDVRGPRPGPIGAVLPFVEGGPGRLIEQRRAGQDRPDP